MKEVLTSHVLVHIQVEYSPPKPRKEKKEPIRFQQISTLEEGSTLQQSGTFWSRWILRPNTN